MEQFLDIFFLAAVAGFILYRLFKVLGQDAGFRPEPVNGEQAFPETSQQPEQHSESSRLHDKIHEIQKLDPTFNQAHFLQGASKAFEMIITAFNEGDKETLNMFVDKKLYKSFEKSIGDAEKNKETWDNSLIRIQKTELVDLKLERTKVYATVRIISDQIMATRDAAGHVIEGDLDQIEVLTDIWTFARNVQSSDPNWILVNTTGIE